MYFWLKNSRFLAVKFAIQNIKLFFYLCYNFHFCNSGRSALGKEGCQVSSQTDKTFSGDMGTETPLLVVLFCETAISNFQRKTGAIYLF